MFLIIFNGYVAAAVAATAYTTASATAFHSLGAHSADYTNRMSLAKTRWEAMNVRNLPIAGTLHAWERNNGGQCE